jgi:integrase
MYNKALIWSLHSGPNPAHKIAMPKTDNRRVHFLSEDEAALLLDELSRVSRTLHDMTHLSLFTGLRLGEISNLTRQDVNFETATIMVKDPKNYESRTTYMNEKLKNLLLRRRPGNFNPSDWIFPDRNGNRIQKVSKAFSGAVRRLGFNENVPDPRDRVVFHTLRHTFAAWLAIRGTPLLTIKELMGHKSIEMTIRYAHLIPDVKREAISRLPDLE